MDRRKRQRVALHWPVRLFRQPGRPSVESTTENLSTAGLYCVSSERFQPGERLRCEIVIRLVGQRKGRLHFHTPRKRTRQSRHECISLIRDHPFRWGSRGLQVYTTRKMNPISSEPSRPMRE
jgi:hypothetical protein